MLTFYFVINSFVTLLTTAIFGVSDNPFYLKPIRPKKDECPHGREMKTED